uniref:Uncharacterized protein n=1 Tax=Anguilla anguilla TaxID=7936 RepID=A0A0E9QUF5_ANGAN
MVVYVDVPIGFHCNDHDFSGANFYSDRWIGLNLCWVFSALLWEGSIFHSLGAPTNMTIAVLV